MDKLRDAAQQALEALMDFNYEGACEKEITALRAALAEQPAEQEPVAWMHTNAVGHTYFRKHAQGTAFKPVPLYTAPQPAKREPLTQQDALEVAAAIRALKEKT